MELKINQQVKQFNAESLSVQSLLDLEIPNKQNGIAVAINNTVIPKSNWNQQFLKETDEIHFCYTRRLINLRLQYKNSKFLLIAKDGLHSVSLQNVTKYFH
jgi:sulfur carrier protein